MRTSRHSDDAYREAIILSKSAAQALARLGLRPAGGNYVQLRDRIIALGLSTAHWTGKAHLRGKRNPYVPKIPLSQILVSGSNYRGSTSLLKRRLIEAGLLNHRCSRCELDSWLGESISLHLDHINGSRNDHRLENLRLLCPNCHSQTPTYCGRNKGNTRRVCEASGRNFSPS